MKKFKINDIVFDSAAKEFVQISNGFYQGEKSSEEFVPTEARAFRVLGFEKNRAIADWTYRKVLFNDLTHVTVPEGSPFHWDALNQPTRLSKYFVGRV